MRARWALVAGVLAALAIPAAAAATPDVTFDQDKVAVVLGDKFTLHTRVTNSGRAPTDLLLAHLNVASLTSDVYVDPEDWSSRRTQELGPLAPGESTTLTWDVQAVNAGRFDIYVVVLPNGAASAGHGPLTVSPPAYVRVAGRRTLDAGGALPVVVVVPVLLGLAAGVSRFRLRRGA
jgi:uncharacterized cupredoxin-like copper-binding protein